ncbi:hypothetical protein KFE25_010083 [Diacronema lutheri]|uniref:TM2 domain-containing protein n=1 Tax=Diacronema lutheri TaxID=2081491 RepID=A0A8J5XK90_DIALT|nr:hypothetical protein KFE25_010083 [Diacronema lutheri]
MKKLNVRDEDGLHVHDEEEAVPEHDDRGAAKEVAIVHNVPPVAQVIAIVEVPPVAPNDAPGGGAPPPYYRANASQGVALAPTKSTASAPVMCIELFIVTVSLGWTGLHWFWLGRPKWGVLYLLTFGLFGVGWAVDILRVPDLVERAKRGFDDKLGRVDLFDMWVLCICPITGLFLAAHHFVLRNERWAIMHVLTIGFLGLGWGVDILRMPCLVHEHNARMVARHAVIAAPPPFSATTTQP